MPPPSVLIGSTEARKLLGDIDRSTLVRWVQLKRIKPAQKLPGPNGAYLFRRRDVEALAAELDKRQGDGSVAVAEHGP